MKKKILALVIAMSLVGNVSAQGLADYSLINIMLGVVKTAITKLVDSGELNLGAGSVTNLPGQNEYVAPEQRWVNDFGSCPIMHNSVDCVNDKKVCGTDAKGVTMCATNYTGTTPTSTDFPGDIPGTNQDTYDFLGDEGFGGGYVLNCYATRETCGSDPSPWVCQRSPLCYDLGYETICKGKAEVKAPGDPDPQAGTIFECGTQCSSQSLDCNENIADGCEVKIGAICCTDGTDPDNGVCTTGAPLGRIDGKCDAVNKTAVCIQDTTFFPVGVETKYSTTTDPLLWGTQTGAGGLIDFKRAGTITLTADSVTGNSTADKDSDTDCLISHTKISADLSGLKVGYLVGDVSNSYQVTFINSGATFACLNVAFNDLVGTWTNTTVKDWNSVDFKVTDETVQIPHGIELSGQSGMLRYNPEINKFQGYVGGTSPQWTDIGAGGGDSLWLSGVNNAVYYPDKVGIGVDASSPRVSLDIKTSDAVKLPAGDDTTRPSGTNLSVGMVRYNLARNIFEGYGGFGTSTPQWGPLGGVTENTSTSSSIEDCSHPVAVDFQYQTILNGEYIRVGTLADKTYKKLDISADPNLTEISILWADDINTYKAANGIVGISVQDPPEAQGWMFLSTDTSNVVTLLAYIRDPEAHDSPASAYDAGNFISEGDATLTNPILSVASLTCPATETICTTQTLGGLTTTPYETFEGDYTAAGLANGKTIFIRGSGATEQRVVWVSSVESPTVSGAYAGTYSALGTPTDSGAGWMLFQNNGGSWEGVAYSVSSKLMPPDSGWKMYINSDWIDSAMFFHCQTAVQNCDTQVIRDLVGATPEAKDLSLLNGYYQATSETNNGRKIFEKKSITIDGQDARLVWVDNIADPSNQLYKTHPSSAGKNPPPSTPGWILTVKNKTIVGQWDTVLYSIEDYEYPSGTINKWNHSQETVSCTGGLLNPPVVCQPPIYSWDEVGFVGINLNKISFRLDCAGVSSIAAGDESFWSRDGATESLFPQELNDKIGIGTSSPRVSLDFDTNDAIQLPKGTVAERDAEIPSPTAGMLRYNTDTNIFEGYTGGTTNAWGALGGGGAVSMTDMDWDSNLDGSVYRVEDRLIDADGSDTAGVGVPDVISAGTILKPALETSTNGYICTDSYTNPTCIYVSVNSGDCSNTPTYYILGSDCQRSPTSAPPCSGVGCDFSIYANPEKWVYLDSNNNDLYDSGEDLYIDWNQDQKYSGSENAGIGTNTPTSTLNVKGETTLDLGIISLKLKNYLTGVDVPQDMKIVGNYAYVSSANAFYVVDVSGKTPVVLGSLPSSSMQQCLAGPGVCLQYLSEVVISGNYAYVISRGDGVTNGGTLQVIDISNPAVPTSVAALFHDSTNCGVDPTAPCLFYPQALAADSAGKYLYAVSNISNGSTTGELSVIDISQPSNPHQVAVLQMPSSGDLTDVFVQGNYVYVTSALANSLQIINVTDPTAPVMDGTVFDNSGGSCVPGAGVSCLQGPQSVYVSGKYAYVAASNSRALQIIDVENPSFPSAAGTIIDNSSGDNDCQLGETCLYQPWSVFVSGNYAYVTSLAEGAIVGSGSLELINISDPAVPRHVASWGGSDCSTIDNCLNYPNFVYVSGGTVYMPSTGTGGGDAFLGVFGNGLNTLSVEGDSYLVGNVGVGTSNTSNGTDDKLTVEGNVVPATTETWSLGVLGKIWKNLFAQTITLVDTALTNNAGVLYWGDKIVMTGEPPALDCTKQVISGISFVYGAVYDLPIFNGQYVQDAPVDGKTSYKKIITGSSKFNSAQIVRFDELSNQSSLGEVILAAPMSGNYTGAGWKLIAYNYVTHQYEVIAYIVGTSTDLSAMGADWNFVTNNAYVSLPQVKDTCATLTENCNIQVASGWTSADKTAWNSGDLADPTQLNGNYDFVSQATPNFKRTITDDPNWDFAEFYWYSSLSGVGNIPSTKPGWVWRVGKTLSASSFIVGYLEDNNYVTGAFPTDPTKTFGSKWQRWTGSAFTEDTDLKSVCFSSTTTTGGYWNQDALNGYIYPTTLTDKVGIGTSTPTAKLNVKGETKLEATGGGTTYPAFTHIGSLVNSGTCGSGGACLDGAHGVAVLGDYAYVVSQNDNALEIIDISGAVPEHKGSILDDPIGCGSTGPCLQNPNDVEVAVASDNKTYAYVSSTNTNSIEVVDVSDPTNPVHVTTILHNGFSCDLDNTDTNLGSFCLNGVQSLFLNGNYLYAGGNNSGQGVLEIIDISTPSAPSHMRTHTMASGTSIYSPDGIFVSDGYVYIANYANGGSGSLEIINISGLPGAEPYLVGTVLNGSGGNGNCETGNTGGACLSGPEAVYIATSGANRYAYLTSIFANALEIIDVTNPSAAYHVGSLVDSVNTVSCQAGVSNPCLHMPHAVAVSGDYAYVSLPGDNTVQVVNVSNRTNPAFEPGVKFESASPCVSGEICVSGSTSIEIQASVTGDKVYIVSPSVTGNGLEVMSGPDPVTIGGVTGGTALSVLGNVGIGTTLPHVSLDFGTTDAVKLPAGTEAERPGSTIVEEGMIRYNKDVSNFEGYCGAPLSWHSLDQCGAGGTTLDCTKQVLTGFSDYTSQGGPNLLMYNASASDSYVSLGTVNGQTIFHHAVNGSLYPGYESITGGRFEWASDIQTYASNAGYGNSTYLPPATAGWILIQEDGADSVHAYLTDPVSTGAGKTIASTQNTLGAEWFRLNGAGFLAITGVTAACVTSGGTTPICTTQMPTGLSGTVLSEGTVDTPTPVDFTKLNGLEYVQDLVNPKLFTAPIPTGISSTEWDRVEIIWVTDLTQTPASGSVDATGAGWIWRLIPKNQTMGEYFMVAFIADSGTPTYPTDSPIGQWHMYLPGTPSYFDPSYTPAVTMNCKTTGGTTTSGYWSQDATNGYLFPATLTNKVGIGTATPRVSLDFDTQDAIQLPKGTDAERDAAIATATEGMIRYSTTSNNFEGYCGAPLSWKALDQCGTAVTTIPDCTKQIVDGIVGYNSSLTTFNGEYVKDTDLTTQGGGKDVFKLLPANPVSPYSYAILVWSSNWLSAPTPFAENWLAGGVTPNFGGWGILGYNSNTSQYDMIAYATNDSGFDYPALQQNPDWYVWDANSAYYTQNTTTVVCGTTTGTASDCTTQVGAGWDASMTFTPPSPNPSNPFDPTLLNVDYLQNQSSPTPTFETATGSPISADWDSAGIYWVEDLGSLSGWFGGGSLSGQKGWVWQLNAPTGQSVYGAFVVAYLIDATNPSTPPTDPTKTSGTWVRYMDSYTSITDPSIQTTCSTGGTTPTGGYWSQTGTNVYLTTLTDYVGIGISNPSEKLEVAGNIAPSETTKFTLGTNGKLWANLFTKNITFGTQQSLLTSHSELDSNSNPVDTLYWDGKSLEKNVPGIISKDCTKESITGLEAFSSASPTVPLDGLYTRGTLYDKYEGKDMFVLPMTPYAPYNYSQAILLWNHDWTAENNANPSNQNILNFLNSKFGTTGATFAWISGVPADLTSAWVILGYSQSGNAYEVLAYMSSDENYPAWDGGQGWQVYGGISGGNGNFSSPLTGHTVVCENMSAGPTLLDKTIDYAATGNTGVFNFDETSDVWILDATNGSLTGNLPPALSRKGQKYYVKVENSMNPVTLTPLAGETIDNQSSYNFTSPSAVQESMILYSNGTEWYIF